MYIITNPSWIRNMNGFKFIKYIANEVYKKESQDSTMVVEAFAGETLLFTGRIWSKAVNPCVYIAVDMTAHYPMHRTLYDNSSVVLFNAHEAMVQVFGHEFAHILQIRSGRRLTGSGHFENSADKFGTKLLKMHRKVEGNRVFDNKSLQEYFTTSRRWE